MAAQLVGVDRAPVTSRRGASDVTTASGAALQAPAGGLEPPAEIDLLVEEEEARVEAADLVERAAPQEKRRADRELAAERAAGRRAAARALTGERGDGRRPSPPAGRIAEHRDGLAAALVDDARTGRPRCARTSGSSRRARPPLRAAARRPGSRAAGTASPRAPRRRCSPRRSRRSGRAPRGSPPGSARARTTRSRPLRALSTTTVATCSSARRGTGRGGRAFRTRRRWR